MGATLDRTFRIRCDVVVGLRHRGGVLPSNRSRAVDRQRTPQIVVCAGWRRHCAVQRCSPCRRRHFRSTTDVHRAIDAAHRTGRLTMVDQDPAAVEPGVRLRGCADRRRERPVGRRDLGTDRSSYSASDCLTSPTTSPPQNGSAASRGVWNDQPRRARRADRSGGATDYRRRFRNRRFQPSSRFATSNKTSA